MKKDTKSDLVTDGGQMERERTSNEQWRREIEEAALAFTSKANICTHSGIYSLVLPIFAELISIRRWKPNGGNMNEQQEARLHEIMRIARKLSWFNKNPKGYPLMEGSEVEKCILMAMDNNELQRFRIAANDDKVVAMNARANPNAEYV